MERVDFLPLGSVCRVKGYDGPVMLVARGVGLRFPKGPRYYDYGGCMWPEGLVGDRLVYFGHESVMEVLFHGRSNGEDEARVDFLNEALSHIDVPRGNPPEEDIREYEREAKEGGEQQ